MKQEVLFTCEGGKDGEIVLLTWLGEDNGCLETEWHRSYLVSTSNHIGYCYRFYEERIEGMQNDTHRDAQTHNSAARDKAAGTMKEAGGHIKESLGALTGNKSMEAQGRKDQKAGAARRKKGTWKDRIKGWIDRR